MKSQGVETEHLKVLLFVEWRLYEREEGRRSRGSVDRGKDVVQVLRLAGGETPGREVGVEVCEDEGNACGRRSTRRRDTIGVGRASLSPIL